MRASHAFPRRGRPVGFTLVELLVVIAIIGVLVSLLLPAIQAAREAARRMNCQSNLKNLALSVANFEAAKKALPQATEGRVDETTQAVNFYLNTMPQFSWIVRVLPFMEQQAIFAQFDLKKSYATYIAEDVTKVPTPEKAQPGLLMCPSDSALGRMFQNNGRVSLTGNRAFGKGNYVAYASPEHLECELVAQGAFGNEPRPMTQIEDGTSNTLMLSEIRTRDDPEDERGAWTLAWNATSILGADVHSAKGPLTRICGQMPSSRSEYTPGSLYPQYAAPAERASAVRSGRRQRQPASCPNPSEADLDGMPCRVRGDTTASPRSLHPGGVNGANADGSVRFLADNIDVVSFGRLICINDGQNSGL